MNLTFIMERNYSLDDLSALRMIFYARKFEIFYITPMEINATITLNFIQHIELLGSQPWGRAAVDSAFLMRAKIVIEMSLKFKMVFAINR